MTAAGVVVVLRLLPPHESEPVETTSFVRHLHAQQQLLLPIGLLSHSDVSIVTKSSPPRLLPLPVGADVVDIVHVVVVRVVVGVSVVVLLVVEEVVDHPTTMMTIHHHSYYDVDLLLWMRMPLLQLLPRHVLPR